jgi:hypothetical protein
MPAFTDQDPDYSGVRQTLTYEDAWAIAARVRGYTMHDPEIAESVRAYKRELNGDWLDYVLVLWPTIMVGGLVLAAVISGR